MIRVFRRRHFQHLTELALTEQAPNGTGSWTSSAVGQVQGEFGVPRWGRSTVIEYSVPWWGRSTLIRVFLSFFGMVGQFFGF